MNKEKPLNLKGLLPIRLNKEALRRIEAKVKYVTRKELIKEINQFERLKGSRCIQGSILFDISAWNKFKSSICEEKK